MEPTKKSPEIDRLLSRMMGRDRRETIMGNTCMTCGEATTGFRDELSRREYRISGMCQKCQDSIWDGLGEEDG